MAWFRALGWLLLVVTYWYFSLLVFQRACPISVDGGGPTTSFYWGEHSPMPTLAQYRDDESYWFRFMVPYWIAAAIVTLLGCAAVCSARHLRSPVTGSIGLTLILLLLAAAISDGGGAVGLWHGPRFYYLENTVTVAKIAAQLMIMAGLLSLGVRSKRDKLMP
jgi:hypothetical protein